MKELNKYSKTVTQDPTQPAAQAMLHAIGLTTEDFFKPFDQKRMFNKGGKVKLALKGGGKAYNKNS